MIDARPCCWRGGLLAVPELLVGPAGAARRPDRRVPLSSPHDRHPKAMELPPRAEHVNLITARWNQAVSAVHRGAIGDKPWA